MSANGNGTQLRMASSEISMALGPGGLYDMSASTSASASTTTSNSPQNGFHAAVDFRPPGTTGVGVGGGAFDLSGMEFGGGYGVPMADREAMLRHFAPVLQQDGQIGVDQDTMMMWSTMPSTYECVFFPPPWR